jgi:homeodomain-containing protein
MAKKYVVKLSVEERQALEEVISRGKSAAWKVQRAQALLKCDAGPQGPGWSDAKIAEAYACTTRSLESWRKRAVEEGPLSLLERKPEDSPRVAPKLRGEQEARLVQLACSQPPPGRARWTLRLLAERLVELEIVDSVSHETVRRAMKKTNCSRGGARCGASRRRKMRRLSARWSKSSRSTSSRTTRSFQ